MKSLICFVQIINCLSFIAFSLWNFLIFLINFGSEVLLCSISKKNFLIKSMSIFFKNVINSLFIVKLTILSGKDLNK